MTITSTTRVLTAVAGLTFASTVCAQANDSRGYAPQYMECPNNVTWSRPAVGLSDQEQSWVNGRRQVIVPALKDYLARLNISGFDLNSYISALSQNESNTPNLGLAISGGGYLSSFTGTGAIRAIDGRNADAVEQKTGGLLQCLTYLSGLSGGSWPTLSFPSYGFPTADELIEYWQPQIGRPAANTTTRYTESTTDIFDDLAAKYEAGFNVSLADFLGQSWAPEFLPAPYGNANVTMSSLALQPNFLNHEMPMSIIQLTEVADWDPEYYDAYVPTANSTMYEVTPFEFGAWEGSVASFTPTKWLGTRLRNGSPINSSACVQGFDKASFIMGTTADAFNFWYLEALSNGTLGNFAKRDAVQTKQPISRVKRYSSAAKPKTSHVKRFGSPASLFSPLIDTFQEYFNLNLTSIMYSVWPNPFAGLNTSVGYTQTASDLRLLDGSTSGQAMPFWAQLHRNMDLIIAWDASGDSKYGWNNGTDLYNTYTAANASGLGFPIIPPVNTIMNYNYSTVPFFFGCDVNLTTTGTADSPIVLHIPNAPYTAYTNYSYFQVSISREQTYEIFENAFNEVTRGNGTLLPGDEVWPTCIGCAAIDRSLMRLGIARPEVCESCFASYCWNGTVDDSTPTEIDPSLVLDPGMDFAQWNMTHPF